ncbi:MAG: family 10 glycosylhydrolase [Elusimicrobia bacterium]|nr:family 10 glycosylhydrolase [Elusimicrobiota bacterium]
MSDFKKIWLLAAALGASACVAPVQAPPPAASVQGGLAMVPVPPEPPTTAAEKEEMRAAWVVSWRVMTSTKAIDAAIDAAHSARLNTLFVQVRTSADAYYKSAFVPRSEYLTGDWDPLAYMLEKGHAKGLKIHAWLNAGIVWRSSVTAPVDPRHIFNAHPDWVLRDSDGKMAFPSSYDPQISNIEGFYWANWSSPEFKDHLAQVAREVADKYPVDGIHLDFVRYPNRSGPMTSGHGQDDATVQRFKKETGKEPLEHTKAWDQWKVDQVVAGIQKIRAAVKAKHPEMQLSAAALGAWDLALGRSWTDYRKGLETGSLDFVVLMSYYADSSWVWKSILNAKEAGDAKRVIVGLGPYMPGNTPEKIAEQIDIARQEGTGGWCLFALDKASMPQLDSYLARLRHLAIRDVTDNRYSLRDPVWNRIGVVDDGHRQWKLRFFSRNGKTKLVIYHRGLTSMELAINDVKLPAVDFKSREYVQLDISPYLLPTARDVPANHDFNLSIRAEGQTWSRGEVFSVDYYAAP